MSGLYSAAVEWNRTQRRQRKRDVVHRRRKLLGPDLQNILRQSYDFLTIMPKLRSTYDKRLIYKIYYDKS